ncbi:MAG: hypothetical protein Q8K30_06825 [Candidatus Gracilibacteria bacterium]|nr:hypothetical protein [Candidatus Gracilibacteria bacterium]
MQNNDFISIEEISDYSIGLMDEIYDDVNKLTQYTTSEAINKIQEINTKLDLARSSGLNVDALDKQMLDFRLVLFDNDLDNILEKITNDDKYIFDTSKVEEEYSDLLKEKGIDKEYLGSKMKLMQDELVRAKIKFMLRHISEGEDVSGFTFDRIGEEIHLAKEKGIDVSDIEAQIFD